MARNACSFHGAPCIPELRTSDPNAFMPGCADNPPPMRDPAPPVSTRPKAALQSPMAARALGGLAILLAGASGTAVVYAVHPGMPYNALQLPYADRIGMLLLAPQGWSFFTRNPREERMTLYGRDESGAWVSLVRARRGSLAIILGLDRAARAQGVEAGGLAALAREDAWRDCGDALPGRCARTALVAGRVVNASPEPSLCGAVAIINQAPVPWAWLQLGKPIHMPARVLRLEVVCSNA